MYLIKKFDNENEIESMLIQQKITTRDAVNY